MKPVFINKFRLAKSVEYATGLSVKRRTCRCCQKVVDKTVLDHNHVTNKTRGLICYSCNMKIAFAEWLLNNGEEMKMIMKYLEAYDWEHPLHETMKKVL